VFLYKLVPGTMKTSFGLNVAQLAGMPKEVLVIADEKRKNFEKKYNKTVIDENFYKTIKQLEKMPEESDVDSQLSILEKLF
jgi:DNA mismatch repair ATPase MutS